MKKLKSLLIVFVLSTITYLFFNPILVFINVENESYSTKKEYEKGDIIKVLDNCNFEEGNWVVYLIINKDDSDNIDVRIPKGKILKTEDVELLKSMKNNWLFKYTGGDLATVQSQIRFYKDDVLMFSSNIVLDKEFKALQNSDFGAVYPIEENIMIKYCMRFERVFLPFVLL
ncbi:hypothetical protein [uncultured Tenacibaculum sp.]|uniref:hypothetical protein n=1 Tax=uncultured Tenacibaculum sp. TaxID=174713 RepID=UPI00260B85C7|nr:hypothetical protein [uncultured Tenacibaculum sp.]